MGPRAAPHDGLLGNARNFFWLCHLLDTAGTNVQRIDSDEPDDAVAADIELLCRFLTL